MHFHLSTHSYLGSREGTIETEGILDRTVVIILEVVDESGWEMVVYVLLN